MAKKGKIADPHADREAQRYDNPIPSREAILLLLREADRPLNHNQICEKNPTLFCPAPPRNTIPTNLQKKKTAEPSVRQK